jgi:hypothetical protein
MKELTSNHDDMDKRLAIFFGLGALIMSTLVGFLLQGVVVLVLAILGGYLFGLWLRNALDSTRPEEELPEGTVRTSRNAESLEEGSLVIPGQNGETVVAEDEGSPSGQVVNFSFPELAPEPMIPSAEIAQAEAAPQAVPVVDEGDLPPPPVPSWLK